jgi:hypothetical protein
MLSSTEWQLISLRWSLVNIFKDNPGFSCCMSTGSPFGVAGSNFAGCLTFVSVVRFQVEVSATGRSLVQRSPTDSCVTVCDLETSTISRPWPALGCCTRKRKCTECWNLRFLIWTAVTMNLCIRWHCYFRRGKAVVARSWSLTSIWFKSWDWMEWLLQFLILLSGIVLN